MADYGTFHHGIVIGIIRDDFQSSRKRNDLGESTDFIRDGCGVGRIHSALEPELFVKFAKDEPTRSDLERLHRSALRLVEETMPGTAQAEAGTNKTVEAGT